MCRKRVIIIGSGLGGLSCGVILAKNGYHVTVLEQSAQVGGCLQCFCRRGAKFETGMHFIGSASQGQTLDQLMTYLEIKQDVIMSQLDPTCYDIIALDGDYFSFANGRDAFVEQLSERFPAQRDNLVKYYDLIEKIAGASTLHSFKHAESESAINTEYQLRSINEVIEGLITDPLLARVLVGNLPLYAGERGKTPFSTHAFIMDFYNQSAFRFVGGSDKVASSLQRTILKYGGQVLINSKATRILCDEKHATGVEVNESQLLEADIVISDAHPIRTFELIDSKLIRPAFRGRINSMPQTVGCFTVYIEFNENTVPYLNSNFYGYNFGTPWNCEKYDETTWPKGYLYMHLCHKPNPIYAHTGVILSYMQMQDVEQWKETTSGHRGDDYEQFKRDKAELLIKSLERHFPNLRSNIKHYYTSTPLTYFDYTGTENGSMYGIAKDVRLGASNHVPHRTRIPNVFQTGQNINSHGMLGVLVGTIVTCSEILSAQKIHQQIINSNI